MSPIALSKHQINLAGSGALFRRLRWRRLAAAGHTALRVFLRYTPFTDPRSVYQTMVDGYRSAATYHQHKAEQIAIARPTGATTMIRRHRACAVINLRKAQAMCEALPNCTK